MHFTNQMIFNVFVSGFHDLPQYLTYEISSVKVSTEVNIFHGSEVYFHERLVRLRLIMQIHSSHKPNVRRGPASHREVHENGAMAGVDNLYGDRLPYLVS